MICSLRKGSRASVAIPTAEDSGARISISIEASLMRWRYRALINVLLLLIKQLPLTAISIMINNVDRIVRAATALNCDALCGYHRVVLWIGGHHRFSHL